MSMGYQVGVTPLQMAAAVSVVANGGMLMRAAPRARRRSATACASRCRRRRCAGRSAPETAATLTTDHGRRRRARHGRRARRSTATRSPARPARPTSWSTAATRSTKYNVVVRRVRAVAQAAHHRRRDDRRADRRVRYFGGVVAAPIFKRIAEVALRQLGVPPHRQSRAAGRRDAAAQRARPTRHGRRPMRPRPAAGGRRPGGVMPGSARPERARRGAHARARSGSAPRLRGTGVVVEQSARRRASPLEPATTTCTLDADARRASPAGGRGAQP